MFATSTATPQSAHQLPSYPMSSYPTPSYPIQSYQWPATTTFPQQGDDVYHPVLPTEDEGNENQEVEEPRRQRPQRVRKKMHCCSTPQQK